MFEAVGESGHTSSRAFAALRPLNIATAQVDSRGWQACDTIRPRLGRLHR